MYVEGTSHLVDISSGEIFRHIYPLKRADSHLKMGVYSSRGAVYGFIAKSKA
jgi:hypothetical protein